MKNKNLIEKTTLRQLKSFILVGLAGFIVNAGLVYELTSLTGPIYAQGIAFPIATSCTWWLNRSYTFQSTNQKLKQEWARYIMANSFGWSINNGAYLIIILGTQQSPILAVAVGSVSGLAFNFFMSRLFVFKNPLINQG